MKNALAVILIFGLFLPLPACHKKSEQDRVKEVIAAVQKAAEEKDIRKIIGNLSRNYRDPRGNDYSGIKGLLLAYFFRHQKIHVFIPDIEVNVENSSARAVFRAVLTGGNKTEAVTDIFPESLGMYTFDVSLIKESGDWKVISAQWEQSVQNQ